MGSWDFNTMHWLEQTKVFDKSPAMNERENNKII